MSIQSSSVLVNLNINTWTARKLDKKVSEEVDADKGARTRAGNYHKKLFAGTKRLDKILAHTTAVRLWNYTNTLPWNEGGDRILPMKNFFDYKKQLNEMEQDFWTLVDEFIAEYNTLVTAAAFQLGDLFNPNDYPSASEVRAKFGFRYHFSPVPDSGDFRVDAGNEELDELKKQYDEAYKNKLEAAMKDMWDRLHECLGLISRRIGECPDGKGLRDSMIENAGELCGMLTKLNVTSDPRLEDARKRLEAALCGVSGADLREDEGVRNAVKARVDEIMEMFG